jgi:hypothetical protein
MFQDGAAIDDCLRCGGLYTVSCGLGLVDALLDVAIDANGVERLAVHNSARYTPPPFGRGA